MSSASASDRDRRFARAEAALLDYFQRAESGEPISFETWVRAQPGIGDELRELHAVCAALRRPSNGAEPNDQALDALGRAPNRYGEYAVEPEPLAQGGMGTIHSAHDRALQRELVLKVLRRGGGSRIARFLLEARLTSQLGHPGIVPVYEIGLDAQRRPYIAMKRVEGRTLASAFEREAAGDPDWTQARLLGVLQRVCEAVSFAHSKGVIHRDLKPANVMVGEFGEVYVMDWGLARELGRKDPHDLRLCPAAEEEREAGADSPLVTRDGAVIGTPAYMPPEQARGEIEKLSTRSDVYSIGALLYHLLARQAPHVPPGVQKSSRSVLASVLAGPPRALHEIRRDLPAELVAICEKALAREPEQRYPDTLALADDLRAYLEGRVVRAYQTGALAEFRKWVVRNKQLALASAAAILITVGSLVWISVVQTRAGRETRALALAHASKAAESVDPMRALLLAREAAAVQRSPDVESQLHSALVGLLEEHVFTGRPGRYAPAVFSPAGDAVLAASGAHTARISALDGSTFVELDGHGHSLCAAAFSPHGQHVVCGYEEGTLLLLDRAGNVIRRLEGHTDTITAVAFSSTGRIASCSLDGTARIWNSDGSLLRALDDHGSRFTGIAWSPTGERLATNSEDPHVRVWDAAGGLFADLAHSAPVSAMAFSPDARRLLTGDESGVAQVWDLATKEVVRHAPERSAVTSVAYSHDGESYAIGCRNGLVRYWAAAGGHIGDLRGHTSAVRCLVFSMDDKLLASAGGADGTARVWDLDARSVTLLRGHTGSVASVEFSTDVAPESVHVLSASDDGTARIWRLKGAEIATYRSSHWGVRAQSVAGLGTEQLLVVQQRAGPALLLDANGKTVHEYGQPEEALHTAKIAHGRKLVLTVSDSGLVRVFRFDEPEKEVGHFETLVRNCLAEFSPQDDRILTWGGETAQLWTLQGDLVSTFDGHEGIVRSAAFSHDGTKLVTGSADGRVHIFDVATGHLRNSWTAHRRAVVSVAFSHKADKVLTAGDQSARIWSLEGGALSKPLLHLSSADVAVFSVDDALIAVGCSDGSTWIWDAQSARMRAQLPGHTAGVIDAEFDEYGHLATACADGNVRVRCSLPEEVLDIVRRRISRTFTPAELKQYETLLGGNYDALSKAYEYVAPELESAVVVDDVRAAVRDDPSLTQDVRNLRLDILSRQYDSMQRVRGRTWEVVRAAGHTAETYSRALGWAKIADDTWHEDFEVRLVLGVALHRTGDQAAALRTLEAVEPKFGIREPGPHQACLAALALVHHALGQAEPMRSALQRLASLSNPPAEPVPFRYREFLDEARALER